MPHLEIRHLRLIKAISETGSITGAALKLNLTQPALSHQLVDLEERLETPLFVRTKKKMILTRAGEKVLSLAHKMLDELNSVELEIMKMVHGEVGAVRIGTTCVFSYHWLPRVMKHFQLLFPKVEIELKTSLDVLADIKEGRLDLVITSIQKDCAGLMKKPIFSDEVVTVMLKSDKLAAKIFLNLEDFRGSRLITYADPIKGDLYRDYLAPFGIEPDKIIKVEQPEAAIELVRNGFGISVFPRWAIKGFLDSGELVARSFTKKGYFLEWYVLHRSDIQLAPYHHEFIRLMQEERTSTLSL